MTTVLSRRPSATRTTRLSVTGYKTTGSVFDVAASGSNYTMSGDIGDLGADVGYFNSMEMIQIYLNGTMQIKGLDVVWASATTFTLNQTIDDTDEILILS